MSTTTPHTYNFVCVILSLIENFHHTILFSFICGCFCYLNFLNLYSHYWLLAPDLSASDEEYDVNFSIPPPPPQPILYGSDEESYSESNFDHIPDFDDYEDDDVSVNIDDSQIDETKVNVSSNPSSSYLQSNHDSSLINIQPPMPTSKSINQSKDNDEITNTEKPKSKLYFENEKIEPPLNLTSITDRFSKDLTREKTSMSFAQSPNMDNNLPTGSAIPSITPSITPSLSMVRNNPSLADNINNILKKQLSNPGTLIKISDYKNGIQYDRDTLSNHKGQIVTSGRSTPAIELDSGFSTARSQDGYVSDKNQLRNNKADEILFTTLPAVNNQSMSDDKSPVSNRVTRTFSSSSNSSTNSDDEETKPKINLRHMLLQHMMNADTESDDESDIDNAKNKPG